MYGPLETMGDLMGGAVKYRRRMISEHSVQYWSVMRDAILSTLEGNVGSTVVQDFYEEYIADLPPLLERNRWEDYYSDDESECAPPLGPRRDLV
jgi:hypothetical protein